MHFVFMYFLPFLFPLVRTFFVIMEIHFIFLLIRFVIIDEAHAYKGAFGCHTALIIRRLRRLCSHGNFFSTVYKCLRMSFAF